MDRKCLYTLGLILLLNACSSCIVHGDTHSTDSKEGLELIYDDPETKVHSSAGRVEVWRADYRAMLEGNVAAERVTLEPQGLAIPRWSDSPKLGYVLEGKAQTGLSIHTDSSYHLRNVRKGDLIAVPAGIGHWVYNNGPRRVVILWIVHVDNSADPGTVDSFYLSGGKHQGWGASVLHGYRKDLLAEALGVDIKSVDTLLGSQKETAILKVKEGLELYPDDSYDDLQYTYNLYDARPTLEYDAGSFRIVTESEFPILKEIKLAPGLVKLAPNALLQPGYKLNGHSMTYVTSGSGYIQVIGSKVTLLDSEASEGSLFMMIHLHPGIAKAYDDGLEFIAFSTSSSPQNFPLTGSKSIFSNIPIEVLAASDNLPIEVEKKLRRQDSDMIMFPKDHVTTTKDQSSERLLKGLSGVFHGEEVESHLKLDKGQN